MFRKLFQKRNLSRVFMTITKGLYGIGSVFLALAVLLSTGVLPVSASPSSSANLQGETIFCDLNGYGGTIEKVENQTSPWTFTVSGSGYISVVGIKAGNGCAEIFESDGTSDCYRVSGIGTKSVTVWDLADAPSGCHEVSHLEIVVVDPAPTNTPTDIPTNTPTFTPTNTPTDIPTDTPTFTPTNTPTDTPTNTPTFTPTFTPTNTPEVTNTPTNTPDPSITPTETPDPTSTPTETPDPTSTPTETPDPTSTPTETPDPTSTPTETPDPTSTPTETPEVTNTPTNTPDPESTPTETPDPTSTPEDPTQTPDPTNTPNPTLPPPSSTEEVLIPVTGAQASSPAVAAARQVYLTRISAYTGLSLLGLGFVFHGATMWQKRNENQSKSSRDEK